MKKLLLIIIGGIVFIGAVWVSRSGTGENPSYTHADELADGKQQPQRVKAPSAHSAVSVETKIDHTQDYAKEELSEPVMELLGLDVKEHNYNSLRNVIGKLSKDLANDDVTALLEILTWPNDRFPEGMRDIEINAVKNDVLDRLLRQNELPVGIGLQLVEMASNPENDPVWRDYCVQFMTPYYERASGELATHEVRLAHNDSSEAAKRTKRHEEEISDQSASSAGELDAVRATMFNALDERDSTIAGTSLIGLELLSRTHDEFDREMIENSALDIAADESASAASRMTALRMAAGLEPADDADYTDSTAVAARLLAQTGETVLLRSAAIVSLGETGSVADRELLVSYTLDENRQIAHAATLALAKMDAGRSQSVELDVEEQVSPLPQSEEKLPPVLIN